jgi:hypothetical protein
MFTLAAAISIQQYAGIACFGPVEETISGWGQYSSDLTPMQQGKIDKLADLIVSSFAQSECAPFRMVSIIGHADKDWHGPRFEADVSFKRATTVQEALTGAVRKLWDDRHMGPAPIGGVEWETHGVGAKHMIAPAYNSANRRVVVTLTRRGAPLPANKKIIEVTAKSFIALIGSRVGSIPGFNFVTLPPPAPPVPVPVPRQTLLEALAKATDAAFNENPTSIAEDKKYRLFSSCRFEVVFDTGGKILAAVPSALETDVGMEGPLQPPPLVTTPVKVSSQGSSAVTFSWFGKGRPHAAAEPAFQEVQPRTSVYIWHEVDGEIAVSGNSLVTTVSIRGSQFPSHRVFVGSEQKAALVQGPFSNLWVADPIDNTKVK